MLPSSSPSAASTAGRTNHTALSREMPAAPNSVAAPVRPPSSPATNPTRGRPRPLASWRPATNVAATSRRVTTNSPIVIASHVLPGVVTETTMRHTSPPAMCTTSNGIGPVPPGSTPGSA
jgi:hypothetical protein